MNVAPIVDVTVAWSAGHRVVAHELHYQARRVTHRRRLRVIAVAVVLTLALALGACGGKSSSSSSGNSNAVPASIRAPKTKFVFHAGLAFGAFHRYLYKPFKAGTYESGAHGRIAAIVKGGLAALFIYHEVKLAIADAQADPTLSKLVTPITTFGETVKSLPDRLRGGNTQDVQTANTQLEGTRATGAQSGVTINDREPSSLSTAGAT